MIDPATKKKASWKQRLFHEVVDYWINVIYLAIVFASFFIHQRLLLASYHITYTNYGVAIIEALILAKVILIGDAIRLGRGLEDKPLIYPTLYKTVVFTFFVAAFKAVEYGIKGLLHGEGIMGGLAEFYEKGWELVLANSLIVVVAFLPYFAVRELGRVMGGKTIRDLFFIKRADK
jgi:hypothetical protein